ncbi:SH3 domain-containing protein [Actinokineospora sp. 24-640]
MLLPKRALIIGGVLAGVWVMYSTGVEPPSGATSPVSGTGTCKVSVTADVLNVRSAPDVRAEIVGKFTQGAETVAGTTVTNGFRMLGDNRWASEEFLKPVSGHDCG